MDFEIKDTTNYNQDKPDFSVEILQIYLQELPDDFVLFNVPLFGKLSIDTTLEELMILFDCHNKAKADKVGRLKYGPGLSFKLESFIKDIQNKCMGLNTQLKDGSETLNFDQAHCIRAKAFTDMMNGKIFTPLRDYAPFLLVPDTQKPAGFKLSNFPFKINPFFIYEAAVGAGYGTVYHGLYEELENLKKFEAQEEITDIEALELPDISNSAALRIGLLYKIGLAEMIVQLSKQNLSAAARVIEQITGIKWETGKKVLQTLFPYSRDENPTHPFHKSENGETINEILERLKIPQERVDAMVKLLKNNKIE